MSVVRKQKNVYGIRRYSPRRTGGFRRNAPGFRRLTEVSEGADFRMSVSRSRTHRFLRKETTEWYYCDGILQERPELRRNMVYDNEIAISKRAVSSRLG